jgi:hypothetical protein
MKHRSILPQLLLLCATASSAQTSSPAQGFYEIRNAYRAFQNEYKAGMAEKVSTANDCSDEVKFPGQNKFSRWEWFNEQRVFPSGIFPSTEMIAKEYEKFLKRSDTSPAAKSSQGNPAGWTSLSSPTVPVGSAAGAGRVNCLAFLPGNANTLFVGTACGGVWKSTNGGTTWSVLNTDQLPSLSIACIAIDPLNVNTIYIATGDNFAGIPNFGKTLQGHFSAGVFKSTDGGLTWTVTGMSYVQSQLMYPQQLIIDPVTPATLLLVSNTGIWRTVNSGSSWTNVKAGNFYSIEFNPLNRNVIFASDGLGLWRSNNNGLTWSYKGGGYPNTIGSRVTLGVTPADTSYVYLWGPTAGFKKSVNGGTSFSTMTNPDATVTPYGYYDRGVAVSNTNRLEVHVAGVSSAKTTDGGLTWTPSSDYTNYLNANYIHQDVKRMVYEPGSGSKIYALTDGGLFVSANDGANWSGISAGLQIAEIYRIGNHPSSADTVYYGTQDCASIRWNGGPGSLTQVYGGDGMQPLVDPLNTMNVFVCGQYGNLQKSTDAGATFSLASPGQCMWIAPYVMNPKNSQTMYIGAKAGVKKSLTGGVFMSWNTVSTGSLDSVTSLAVTRADTSVVYAAKLGKIVRSGNGGTGWTDITGTLPVTSAGITYITVSPTDKDKVWVTFSGYSAGNKVFFSSNGGTSWVNYSGTLPNVPVNCAVYVNGSNDALYIGTDFGVFQRDAGASDWTAYNTGLPNVIVNHLDIFYPALKLRAGTYGRGLWETSIPGLTTGTRAFDNLYPHAVSVAPNPSGGIFSVKVSLPNEEFDGLTIGLYDLLGKLVHETKINGQKTEVRFEANNGVYFYRISNSHHLISSGKLIIQ